MDRRLEHKLCIAMVLFASVLRLAAATGLDAPAEQALTFGVSERSHTLRFLPAQTSEPEVFPVELLPAQKPQDTQPPGEAAAPEAAPTLDFREEEADRITVSGSCTYPVDTRALLCGPLALTQEGDSPAVLIVHTHTCEAYTPSEGWEYEPTEFMRTLDAGRSVVRVGDAAAEVLAAAGIRVIHDTSLNDYPSYEGSYERMRRTIERYLAQDPSIRFVLDLHRDAAVDERGFPVALRAEQGGTSCAQVMFVVGTDEGGLPHPDWRENLSLAVKLQALLNRTAPGLCRDIDLRSERFNQHETPGSLLCEIGSTGNTLPEAIASAQLLAGALAELILSSQP